jgi:hypothetical protein
MGTHNSPVEHRVFVVGICRQVLEHPFPHPRLKHRFDKQAVICGSHPDCFLPTAQNAFDPLPLVIAQPKALHGQPPTKLAAPESNNASRRNPLRQALAKITARCCNFDSPVDRECQSPAFRPG